MAIIIAEFCQNHKGDLSLLKEMVWAAANAGATYAKVQSMLASDLTYRERFEQGAWEDGAYEDGASEGGASEGGAYEGGRQTAIKRPYQPEYDRLKPMDLSDEGHWIFVEECKKAGIQPLTTIFSRSRIPFVASLGMNAIKVASYDCASLPMLRELKEHFGHLFISTGATYDQEVEAAADLLGDHPFSFLHAVTIYPTPLDELHLRRMEYLRRFTPSVGFSDHTLVARDGIKAALVALSLGAEVIERHFTILTATETKDGPVSIGPEMLRQLVEFGQMSNEAQREYVEREIPEYEQMLGESNRPLSPVEELNRDYYRGRFASKVGGETIYNWEDRPVLAKE